MNENSRVSVPVLQKESQEEMNRVIWCSTIARAHSNDKVEFFKVSCVNVRLTTAFDTTLFNSEITKVIKESRVHAVTDVSADKGEIARF